MAAKTLAAQWTDDMVRDPASRARRLRAARVVESVFSLIGTGFLFVAVWAFTGGRPVNGLPALSVGGLALLCFNGCMLVAASGGIERRLIDEPRSAPRPRPPR